jgi:peptidoglycan-associated lipoprotein
MKLSRTLFASALSAAVLTLTACGSSVKLDDTSAADAAPITTATTGADANAASSNNVASVVVPDQPVAADASNLPRVIYFDFDSFVVKPEFTGAIDGHAKRLNAAKGTKIVIEGHTDERGGREYNLALGQKRAEAVQKSLTLLGVSGEQIEAVSFGEERPAAQGSGEAAWSQNRRAEIKDR